MTELQDLSYLRRLDSICTTYMGLLGKGAPFLLRKLNSPLVGGFDEFKNWVVIRYIPLAKTFRCFFIG